MSVVIPTYRREQVLVDTVSALLKQRPRASEILVVDQTRVHEAATDERLKRWETEGAIRWLRLSRPSIPAAMNAGLIEAREALVLFVDDDIAPGEGLIDAHVRAHRGVEVSLVAGRVIQPWDEDPQARNNPSISRFFSTTRGWSEEFIGANFSIRRALAVELGGFDENFVQAAYRFENEFAYRLICGGGRIWFEPEACIRHLKVPTGGTRAFAPQLTSPKPSQAVGEYYYLLRCPRLSARRRRLLFRPLKAVKTRHHLRRPWWIPVTLVAEGAGFLWALFLAGRGPRRLASRVHGEGER